MGVAWSRKTSPDHAQVLPVFLSDIRRDQLPPPLARTQGLDAWNLGPDRVAEQVAEMVQKG